MSETKLTAEEQAYFDNHGDVPEATTEQTQETSQEVTPSDPGHENSDENSETRVPHRALHEERQRRKEIEAELSKLQQTRAADMARMEERLAMMKRAFQPQQQMQPQQPPNPADDPLGYVQHIGQVAQQTHQAQQQMMQHFQAQEQINQLRTWAVAQENEFKGKSPDYDAAMQHLRTTRATELQALGMNPQQIVQAMEADIAQIAMMARQEGVNPAERLYNIAKIRGFTGATPAPAVTEQADTINRGQQLGTRVPSNGASPQNMTAARLLEMSEADFDAWIKRHPAQAKRILGE